MALERVGRIVNFWAAMLMGAILEITYYMDLVLVGVRVVNQVGVPAHILVNFVIFNAIYVSNCRVQIRNLN